MISVDSVESVPKRRTKSKSKPKGRLVRSLDFIQLASGPKKRQSSRHPTITKGSGSTGHPKKSIWRDSSMPAGGYMTHKMSSVTNNFMSSDLLSSSSSSGTNSSLNGDSSDSDIDELVGDLVDPGRGTLVFPQHDEVFRSSPLSTSSIINEEDEAVLEEESFEKFAFNNENVGFNNFEQTLDVKRENNESIGTSWNPKQNRWVPLVFRYVFPSSAFTINTTQNYSNTPNTNTHNSIHSLNSNNCWSLKNGFIHFDATLNSQQTITKHCGTSFKFSPPKKSIMMGPDGLLTAAKIDSDARDVCEKLLELMDDKNLLLPADSSPCKSSAANKTSFLSTNNPPQFLAHHQPSTNNQYAQLQAQIQNPGKSLLSEWSSLPSSPPPPIFHDVCNRPIPELRLSPPMTGKSLGKRLFAAAGPTNVNNKSSNNTNNTANNNNSLCDSPLTKRLRFSSSNSSLA